MTATSTTKNFFSVEHALWTESFFLSKRQTVLELDLVFYVMHLYSTYISS